MKWQALKAQVFLIKSSKLFNVKKEVRVFFTSLMFFTRLPCPKWVDHSPEYFRESARYLPLVGIIVGLIGAIVYSLSSLIFPKSISILLSMVSTIYVTGAFHEDGLSDMVDGFGAGWTKTDILKIMKDSHTGTYGVIALLSVLSLKFASLYQISPMLIPLAIVAAQSLSRFCALTLLFTHDYARDSIDSKVKSAASKISLSSLVVGAIFTTIPLLLFYNSKVFLTLIPVFTTLWYLGRMFKKRIGGQTGDCLGGIQQITEIIFYLSFILVWKYI